MSYVNINFVYPRFRAGAHNW